MFNVRLAVATCLGNGCLPGCRCDVFDGIFLCCRFFPLDVLDEIWDFIESVSEGYLNYSSNPSGEISLSYMDTDDGLLYSVSFEDQHQTSTPSQTLIHFYCF